MTEVVKLSKIGNPMKKLRKIFSFLFIFVSLILIFTFLYSEEEFLVKEVVDGDTVKLTNGEIVRYLGIDTSELRWYKGGSWIYHPQPFANEAKNYNISLVEGKKVKLEYDVEKKDKFKRFLAYVYVDNLLVNAEILKQGYAFLDIRVPNVKHSKELAEAYQQAKKERIGLWKEASVEIITPAQVKNFSGKIKTIEGKITRILDKKKIIKLVLDGEEKSEFGIVIYKNNLSLFRKEGVNPGKDYLNRKVRLSGLIREYKKGFEIVVNHPAEIEVIE